MTDRHLFVPGGGGPTIVGGAGCWLHTADGRRILDAAGGAMVGNVGYGRPEVADAVAGALRNGAYVLPLWPTPERVALVEELQDHWLPPGIDRVFFTSGGSESADSALRLARAHHVAAGRPERWKIVGRHPSYHGITLAALAAGSHDGRRRGYEPLLPSFPHVPWDDAEAAVKVIEAEDPATIAAFVFEPITGAAGACLEADDGYWRTVGEACRHHGILLVADEVMTGFGRTGTRWGHDHLPVRPDIVYGGKGLGGGYVPAGMVAATAAVVEPLRGTGFMFFTFTGADAVCAGARAVLQILRHERLVERAAAMGDVLAARLEDSLRDHAHVQPQRGRGLFRGLELVADRATGEPFPRARGVASTVVRECLANDVWVYPAGSGPVQDAIMLGPPFVVDESEVELIVDTLTAAVDVVTTAAAR